MLQSAHLLAKAGAQLLICPDNTLHQALPCCASTAAAVVVDCRCCSPACTAGGLSAPGLARHTLVAAEPRISRRIGRASNRICLARHGDPARLANANHGSAGGGPVPSSASATAAAMDCRISHGRLRWRGVGLHRITLLINNTNSARRYSIRRAYWLLRLRAAQNQCNQIFPNYGHKPT